MEETSKASSSMSNFTVEKAEATEPHEALFLVIAYLPVYEILTMSQICNSLRDAVNNDILLWLNVVVERPLNSRLSDDILFKITSKANGRLQTLALMKCTHITNQGLQRVIEQNPFINKLYIPGCTGITPEGILTTVKTLCQRSNCLSKLSINGIYNLQKEHLDMLNLYIKKNLPLKEQQKQQKPIYYHNRTSLSVFKREENQQIIDLEICPKCFEVRMVYDCPKGDCKKEWSQGQCKGCIFCIPRCEECGECVESQESEEGACGDILCLQCWLQLPKCNFCNKPYCKQHTDWWCTSSDSCFLCKVCDENSHGYTYNDVL